jgi:DNA-binding NarL/FixJ family response regulator
MKAYGSVAPPYWSLLSDGPASAPIANGRLPHDMNGNGESPRAGGVDSRPLDGELVAADAANATSPKTTNRTLPPNVHVLVVDDCMLFRDNLAAVIAASGAVVGVAWDLPTLVTAVEHTSPDIILVNIATHDSARLLDAASTTFPNARLIVLGVSEDDESTIVGCAEAGVAGYHTRNQSFEDLLVLMGKVASGESMCSPRVSAVLLRRLSTLASAREPVKKELVLTTREAQILQMLRAGMSNRDIAIQLSIAIHTVKNHVHSLLNKLGVTTRAEAAALSPAVRRTPGPQRN